MNINDEVHSSTRDNENADGVTPTNEYGEVVLEDVDLDGGSGYTPTDGGSAGSGDAGGQDNQGSYETYDGQGSFGGHSPVDYTGGARMAVVQ